MTAVRMPDLEERIGLWFSTLSGFHLTSPEDSRSVATYVLESAAEREQARLAKLADDYMEKWTSALNDADYLRGRAAAPVLGLLDERDKLRAEVERLREAGPLVVAAEERARKAAEELARDLANERETARRNRAYWARVEEERDLMRDVLGEIEEMRRERVGSSDLVIKEIERIARIALAAGER